MLILFSSIVLSQQDSSANQKAQTSKVIYPQTVKPNQKIIKPNNPSGKNKVFGRGDWNVKSIKPLDGKGNDVINNNALKNNAASGLPTGKRQINLPGVNKVSPDVIDPLNKSGDADHKVNTNIKQDINKISPDHKVNTNIQKGINKISTDHKVNTTIRHGVNKVSPDVINPVDGEAQDKNDKVNTNIQQGINKVSPDVIDPAGNKNINTKIKGAGGEIKITPKQQQPNIKMKSGNKENNKKGKNK